MAQQINYIQVIKTVLTLLPLVIEAVRAIEAAMPEAGAGAAKLNIIKTTLQSAYSVANDATVSFDAMWPVLSGMVGSIVAAMNLTGAFKKSTPAA